MLYSVESSAEILARLASYILSIEDGSGRVERPTWMCACNFDPWRLDFRLALITSTQVSQKHFLNSTNHKRPAQQIGKELSDSNSEQAVPGDLAQPLVPRRRNLAPIVAAGGLNGRACYEAVYWRAAAYLETTGSYKYEDINYLG
jgi:hypothetical protein